MTRKTPKPPPGLSAKMRRWWTEVVAGWEVDGHHVLLLELACRSWDRAEAAAKTSTARSGLDQRRRSWRGTARRSRGLLGRWASMRKTSVRLAVRLDMGENDETANTKDRDQTAVDPPS